MYDPYESPVENEKEVEVKPHRLPIRGIACFLLLVMLCSVISTPLAAFLIWNNLRERPTPTAVPDQSTAETAITDEPPQSVGVNRIAYITPQRQLATVAPDGADQRLLTDVEQLFQFPAWSPDNSQLAVIGSEVDNAGVYVIADQPDSELQLLYESQDEAPFYLYWSPDSQQVTFLANHPSGLALHISDILADTSRILATGSPFYWHWTPAGDRILIHSGFSGEDSRLALLDPNGNGDGDDIDDNSLAPGFFQAPGISPNGRLWAYAQVDDEDNGQLTVSDGETGQTTRTEPHRGLIAMNWSPVSDVLAFITPGIEAPVFYGPLHLLDAETGESSVIVDDLVVAFFWSPDGRYIAYFTVADTDDNTIQAGKTDQLSKPAFQEDAPLVLEVWVADTQEGSVRRLRAFEPSDLFVFQFLPFFDQYALSHRIWSPDSGALVLPIMEDGAPHISVVPIDGGETTVVGDGVLGFWSQ